MLVLSRKEGESVIIDGTVKLTIVNVGQGRVRIGIQAPPHVRIDREEVHIAKSEDVMHLPHTPTPDDTLIIPGPATDLHTPTPPVNRVAPKMEPRTSRFRRDSKPR